MHDSGCPCSLNAFVLQAITAFHASVADSRCLFKYIYMQTSGALFTGTVQYPGVGVDFLASVRSVQYMCLPPDQNLDSIPTYLPVHVP
jgi:hypothetical protein